MSAEIIPFPKQNSRQLPTLQDLQQNIEQNCEQGQTIDTATEILSSVVLENLISLGYPLEIKQGKDICFVIESIRSLMHKYYDLDHPYQTLADISFKRDEESGGMMFMQPAVKKSRSKKNNTLKVTANTNI